MRGVSGDDPEGGAGSGVAVARTALREVRTPTARQLRPGAGSRCGSGGPLPETTAWGRGRKSPRGSAERGPGRTGTGPRLTSAGVAPRKRDKKKECACRRSIHPSFGVAVRTRYEKEGTTRTQSCGAGTGRRRLTKKQSLSQVKTCAGRFAGR